jgi:hypothetical protein
MVQEVGSIMEYFVGAEGTAASGAFEAFERLMQQSTVARARFGGSNDRPARHNFAQVFFSRLAALRRMVILARCLEMSI